MRRQISNNGDREVEVIESVAVEDTGGEANIKRPKWDVRGKSPLLPVDGQHVPVKLREGFRGRGTKMLMQ